MPTDQIFPLPMHPILSQQLRMMVRARARWGTVTQGPVGALPTTSRLGQAVGTESQPGGQSWGEALATGVPAAFFFPSQEIDTPRKVKWPLQGYTAWASQKQKPGFLPRGFLLSLSLCGEQGPDYQDIGVPCTLSNQSVVT